MKIKYIFCLDEVGDHGLSYVDEKFPIFLLAGSLFEISEYKLLCQKINQLKQDLFGTTEVILHSRDIRKCEGVFQIFFDLDIKKQFYQKFNDILSQAKFEIISAVLYKEQYIEKYGKSAGDPYAICLSYLLESLIQHLDTNFVEIIIEKRGKKEDAELLAHYNSIRDRGTFLVTAADYKSMITDYVSLLKRENHIGLQITDLCAYPLARDVLNPQEPYIPFEVIKNKIHDLKVFP